MAKHSINIDTKRTTTSNQIYLNFSEHIKDMNIVQLFNT
jgi:hypothetical protein